MRVSKRNDRNAERTGRLFVTLLLVTASVLLLGDRAEAQETPAKKKAETADTRDKKKTFRLPDVVITATENEEFLYTTPLDYSAARDVIEPREVRESGALNVQELLRRTPSAYFFEESGTDSKPNIAIRGVTGGSGASRSGNVSLLADGIPLAPAPYGHAGQSLFPFTLERVDAVDMLRGGHTVRYGPNTVSGVINFLTRPIPDRFGIEQRLKVNSYGDYSSYTGFGGTTGDFGFLAESVSKWGQTYRDHGDFIIQNYALKMSYRISDRILAFAQFEYFDDDSELADGLGLAAFRRDPEQSLATRNRFEGDQTRGNVNFEIKLDDNSHIDLTAYAFSGDRTFFLGKPIQYGGTPSYIDATPRPMSVWAIQPSYTLEYDLGDVDGELVSGLRYHVEDIARKSWRIFPTGAVTVRSNNQYDYTVWSGFVENTFWFDKFALTPGVRIENVDIDGKNQLTGLTVYRDFTEFLPALSGSYMIQDEWSVYANVQTSFLPPQAAAVELTAAPQNLEAQYAWTYEVGTRSRMWDGIVSPDLCLYRIDYRDRIEDDPVTGVAVNKGNTRHQGVELTLDSDLGAINDDLQGLEVYSQLSFNDSQYRNGEFEDNTVPQAPHWLAAWGITYHHEDTGLWGGIDGFYVGEAYSDSDNTVAISADGTEGKRPSFTVWNAKTGYKCELAEDVKMEIQVGCNNLLDEEYFEMRSGKGLFLGPPIGLYAMLMLGVDF